MTALWELPEGWEWVKFSEVATVASDLVDPAGFQDTPHIAPNHIESGTGRLLEYATVAADKVTSPKHRFKPGQILYSKIRPYLCKAVLIDFAGVCSADMYPINSKIDAAYLHCWMISSAFTEQASGQQGRTVLPKINQEALALLSVPVPPLAEQRRIVARVEALKARSRKVRTELEPVPRFLSEYRQSVLAAAFRGDLTAQWREQRPGTESASALLDRVRHDRQRKWESANRGKKYTRPKPVEEADVPDLPAGWCWATAEEVVADDAGIRYGIVQPGPPLKDGVPYVRGVDIQDGQVLLDQLWKTSPAIDEQYRGSRLREGDVLLGIIRHLKVAVVPKELDGGNMARTTARLRPSPLVSTEYLAGVLASPFCQTWLKSNYRGGTSMPKVNIADVCRLPIPIAPRDEQAAICEAVRQSRRLLDVVTAEVSGALAECVRLEESILAAAFRGELVEQNLADEPATVLLERIRVGRNGTAQTVAVTAPQHAAKLLVVRYIVMLLRTWNAKAARETLETCLVLMLNDDARRAILGKKPAAKAKTKKAATGRTHMPGLDHLLGELVAARFLTPPETVRGKQVFGLGANAPPAADLKAHARAEDEGRLKETLDALDALGEERSRLELDAVSHATYELVS